MELGDRLEIIFWILFGIAFLLSAMGNILINFKRKQGFIIWLISNIGWLVVSFLLPTVNWFQVSMFVFYIILNLHGFCFWNNIEKNEASRWKH